MRNRTNNVSHYSKKYQLDRLRFLIKKLKALSEDSLSYSTTKMQCIYVELLKNLKALSKNFKRKSIEKIIGTSLAGIILLLNPATINAQTFLDPERVSYNFAIDSLDAIFLNLVDIDNDGDLDIMGATYDNSSGGFYWGYSENIGDPTSPVFDTLQVDPFSLDQGVFDSIPIVFQAYADMDGDLDMDIVMSYLDVYSVDQIWYHENIGTPDSAKFDTIQIIPLLNGNVSINPHTAITDLDGDNDLDVLSVGINQFDSQINGANTYDIMWLENNGSADSMSFEGGNFNPMIMDSIVAPPGDLYIFHNIEAQDFDNDGDDDIMFIGSLYYGSSPHFFYYENIDTFVYAAPVFINNISIQNKQTSFTFADSGDLDGDGDFDILHETYIPYSNVVNDLSSDLFFIENTGEAVNTFLPRPLEGNFEIRPNPSNGPISLFYEVEVQGVFDVEILNNAGKRIALIPNQNLSQSGNIDLQLDQLNPGMYYLRIRSNNEFKTIKFIIQ